MKKLPALVIIALIAILSGMTGIFWMTQQKSRSALTQLKSLDERKTAIANMRLDWEEFRRVSAKFRTLGEAERDRRKTELKKSVDDGLAHLASLNPSKEETATAAQVAQQAQSFLMLANKVEPRLYTKDVYQNDQIRAMHDDITAELEELNTLAESRKQSLLDAGREDSVRSIKLFILGGALILGLVALLLVRNFLIHIRPIRKLKTLADAADEGHLSSRKPQHLAGPYGEIAKTLRNLSEGLDKQRQERHQFIQSVASDLRMPLMILQSGGQPQETMQHALAQLAGSLDDLTDVVSINQLHLKLNDRVFDLAEVVQDFARVWNAAGVGCRVEVTAPAMPTWVLLDRERFERVLMHLFTKAGQIASREGRITVEIARKTGRGIELSIYDRERQKNGRVAATGPEQDLLSHWCSERGFGMIVAHKILRAHGGTINASGVQGASLKFTLRFPEERVANGMISPLSAVDAAPVAPGLEYHRIQTVLPNQAIHFGS